VGKGTRACGSAIKANTIWTDLRSFHAVKKTFDCNLGIYGRSRAHVGIPVVLIYSRACTISRAIISQFRDQMLLQIPWYVHTINYLRCIYTY